jgi:sugar phosphate isomerase/epimerase
MTEAAAKGMLSYVAMASKLKTDLSVGRIKGNIPVGVSLEPYLARLASNLREICSVASDCGVKILLAVINHYETNLFTTTKETLDFMNRFDLPNCFIQLDTYDMGIEEAKPFEAMQLCGKKLGHFRVADNTRCWPGNGTHDFHRYLTTLNEIGYEGFVTVECLAKPDGITAAQKAIEHLKQCQVENALYYKIGNR